MGIGRNGGIIGVTNAPTPNSASAVWTLNEVRDAVAERKWPGSAGTLTHVPAGTTPLLQFSGEDDATTFATNTISGAVNGTLTHNASGGPSAKGYVTGWGATTNIDWTAFSPHNNARSLVCWYRGIQSGDNGSAWLPYVSLFCGAFYKLGINNNSIASSNAAGDMTEGATSVVDGSWHMLCWTFAGNSTGDVTAYTDGNNVEAAVTQGPVSAGYLVSIFGDDEGAGGSGTLRHPTDVAGIQIFANELTGTQVQEIYDAGLA